MISLKDWRLDILNNEGTTSETYTTKGKYITIGSSLTCNIRYFDQRVLKKHCKICINVKGKIQIINYAKNDTLLVDNEPIVKRSILENNAIISLHDKKFLWKYNPKTNISLNKRKSLRRSIREKSIKLSKSILSCHKRFVSKTPTICSLARKSRIRKKKSGKRITVHNFEHMTNQLNKTSATECFSTPVSILEFKENKTPRNASMALSNSGVLITSYPSTPVGRCMRNSSFQTPKSGLKQNIVNMSTPKSVYKTPKGVLSEINETLSITKTPESKNSMHLIDLTTPMTVKKNPASIIQKNTLSSVAESVVDLTTPKTPRTPKASTVKSNVKLLKSALKNASTRTAVNPSINLKTITSSRKGTPISETKCTEDVIVLLESPSTRSRSLRMPVGTPKSHANATKTASLKKLDNLTTPKRITNSKLTSSPSVIPTTPGCSSKKTSVEELFQTPIKLSKTPVNVTLSGVKRLARTPSRKSTNTKKNLTDVVVKSSVLRPTTPTITDNDNDCNDYNGELSNLLVQRNKNTDYEISSENIVTNFEKPSTTVAADHKSGDNIEDNILIGTEDKEVNTISIDIPSKTEYKKYEQDLFVQDAFDILIGKPVIKSTYTRKGKSLSPNKKFSSCQLLSNTTDLSKPDIVSWIKSIETPILKPNCTRQILSSRYSNVTPHESFLDQKLSDETCEGLNEKQRRHSLISKRIQAVDESDLNSSCQYSSRRLSTLVLSPVTRISIIDHEKVIMAEENILNSQTTVDNDKDDAINISTKLTSDEENDMSEVKEICEEIGDEQISKGKPENNFDNFTDCIEITAASSTVNVEVDKSSYTVNKNEELEMIGNAKTEIENNRMDDAESDLIIQSNDTLGNIHNEDIEKITEDILESSVAEMPVSDAAIVEVNISVEDENSLPEQNTTVDKFAVSDISVEKVIISEENEIASDNRTTETDTENIQNNENEKSTSEICDSINNSVVLQEQEEDTSINNIFDVGNTTFEITDPKMSESITDDVEDCTETKFGHSQEMDESDIQEKDTSEGIEFTNITEPNTVSIDEKIISVNNEDSTNTIALSEIISVKTPELTEKNLENFEENDLVEEENKNIPNIKKLEIDDKSEQDIISSDGPVNEKNLISEDVLNIDLQYSNIPPKNDNNIVDERITSNEVTIKDVKNIENEEKLSKVGTSGDEDKDLDESESFVLLDTDDEDEFGSDEQTKDMPEAEKQVIETLDLCVEAEKRQLDTIIETRTNDKEIIDLSKVEDSISDEQPAVINIVDDINLDNEEHSNVMPENEKEATEPHVETCEPVVETIPIDDEDDLQDQNVNELVQNEEVEVLNESNIKTPEKMNLSPNHEKRKTVHFAKPEEEEEEEKEEDKEVEKKEEEQESDNVSTASANIEYESDAAEYFVGDQPEDLTTTPVKEPRNDLTDVVGVKELLKTPNPGPRNDLTDVRGLRNLMRTPGNIPRNDLTDIIGVKELLKTPNPGPKNALTDVVGVKELLKTPNPGPRNDLTDVRGVKNLMRTPCNNPRNDLSDIVGVKELMKTPNPGPKNDLTDVRGMKTLLKTPGKEPQNDLNNVVGVKELLSTPNPGPKNDLSNLAGVRNLMRTPGNKPSNDLSNVVGVKELLKTPNSGPKNELTNLVGVKNLLKTPCNKPRNDLTNVVGVKELLLTPNPGPKNDLTIVSGVKDLLKTPSNKPMDDSSDINVVTSPPRTDIFEVKPIDNDVQETEITSASEILGETKKRKTDSADEVILINNSIDLDISDTPDTISDILPTVDTDGFVESTQTEELNTFEKIRTSEGLHLPTVEEAVASLHKESEEMIITPHNDQIIDNSNEAETENLESEGNIAQGEAVPEVRHNADSSIIEAKEIIKHDKSVADIEIVPERSTDEKSIVIPARTRRRRMTEDIDNETIKESKVKKIQSAPQIPNSRTRRRAVFEKPLTEEKDTAEEVNSEENLPTVSKVEELNADKPKMQPIELGSGITEDQTIPTKPQRKGRKAKEMPIVNVETESVQVEANIQISDDPKISSITMDTKPVIVLPVSAEVSTPIRSKRLINKKTIEENKNILTLEKDVKSATKKRQPRNTGKQDKAKDVELNVVDVQPPVSPITESENIKETKVKRQPRKGKKNDGQAAKEATEIQIVEAAELIVSESVTGSVPDIQDTPRTKKRVNKRNAGVIASSTPLLPVIAKRGRRNQVTQNMDDEVQISSIQYDTLDPADNTATKPKRGRKVSHKTEEEVIPVPIMAEKPKRQTKKTAKLGEIENIALSTKIEEPDISTTDARPKRQIKITAKMAQIKHVESNISVVESKPKRQNKRVEKVIEAGSPKLEAAPTDVIDDTKKKTQSKSAELIATPSIKIEIPVDLANAASTSIVRSKRLAKKILKVDKTEEQKTEDEKSDIVQLSSGRSKRQAKTVTGKKNSSEAVEIIATPKANSKTRGKRNLKLDEAPESQSLKVPEVDLQHISSTSSPGERPKRQSKKPLKLLEEQETEIKLTPAKKRAGRKAVAVTPEEPKTAASSKSKKVSSQSSEVLKEPAKTVTKELKRISDSKVQGEELDNPPKKKKNEDTDKKSDEIVIGKRTLRSRK